MNPYKNTSGLSKEQKDNWNDVMYSIYGSDFLKPGFIPQNQEDDLDPDENINYAEVEVDPEEEFIRKQEKRAEESDYRDFLALGAEDVVHQLNTVTIDENLDDDGVELMKEDYHTTAQERNKERKSGKDNLLMSKHRAYIDLIAQHKASRAAKVAARRAFARDLAERADSTQMSKVFDSRERRFLRRLPLILQPKYKGYRDAAIQFVTTGKPLPQAMLEFIFGDNARRLSKPLSDKFVQYFTLNMPSIQLDTRLPKNLFREKSVKPKVTRRSASPPYEGALKSSHGEITGDDGQMSTTHYPPEIQRRREAAKRRKNLMYSRCRGGRPTASQSREIAEANAYLLSTKRERNGESYPNSTTSSSSVKSTPMIGFLDMHLQNVCVKNSDVSSNSSCLDDSSQDTPTLGLKQPERGNLSVCSSADVPDNSNNLNMDKPCGKRGFITYTTYSGRNFVPDMQSGNSYGRD